MTHCIEDLKGVPDQDLLQAIIARATHDTNMVNLCGYDPINEDEEKADGLNPYDRAITLLRRGITDLEHLRDHRHSWSEEGFCGICGADGNA